MSKILLAECQRLADEFGALMAPPATLKVSVERASRTPAKGEGPAVVAIAHVTSVPASHQRVVQADAAGASESEALAFLKAALALKMRFVLSGSSGTRRRVPPGTTHSPE